MSSLLPHFKRKLIMATITNANTASLIAAALGGNTQTSAKEDKKQAQIYLNIGITIPLPNAQGETVDTFVSLPFGLPLDTMSKMVSRGNNPEWNQMVGLKNSLLEALSTLGESLEKGSGKVLPKLECQLYHRKDDATVQQPSGNAMELILKALS